MKLIDADKLPWVDKVILVDNVDGDIVIKVAPNYTSYVNKETPTVEAIPIEWIEKEMKRLDEDIKWAWYYGNVALDKMEYLKMWLTLKLEDWEKENIAKISEGNYDSDEEYEEQMRCLDEN